MANFSYQAISENGTNVAGAIEADSAEAAEAILLSRGFIPSRVTSADAAGLPILPGLVRWDEVRSGAIRHAIRFTAPQTCEGYVYPARHQAGDGSCDALPPMGLRVRLKALVDISGFGRSRR